MENIRRRRFLMTLVVLVALAIPQVPASAGPSGSEDPPAATDGTLNSDGLRIATTIARRNSPPTSTPPPPPPTYNWVTRPWVVDDNYCEEGQIHYYSWRVDIATGWTLRFYRILGFGRDPSFAENSPINPSDFDPAYEVWFVHVCYGPPTSVVEAVALGSEALPPPTLGLSPDAAAGGGLTGLDTWMWHEYDHGRYGDSPSISLNVPVTDPASGITYTVTGSAWATGYQWTVLDGDETFTYSALYPGTEGADTASAVHVFQTKGANQITMSSEWVGEYQMTGYTGTEVLGPILIGDTVGYPTIEIRAVVR